MTTNSTRLTIVSLIVLIGIAAGVARAGEPGASEPTALDKLWEGPVIERVIGFTQTAKEATDLDLDTGNFVGAKFGAADTNARRKAGVDLFALQRMSDLPLVTAIDLWTEPLAETMALDSSRLRVLRSRASIARQHGVITSETLLKAGTYAFSTGKTFGLLQVVGNVARSADGPAGVRVRIKVIDAPQRTTRSARDAETLRQLRERGPAGLEDALAAYDRLVELLRQQESDYYARYVSSIASTKGGAPADDSSAVAERAEIEDLKSRIDNARAAVDEIGGQRSCTVSRLYWYTDLDQAKAESARTGRPILHLRMLGKLTDEYSCANSRFFRTSLYSNQEISDYLRENFILHWQSVRPVPRVTIDFGDGRRLERTLTGNSAHYVLAADGRPLDVLPGLYAPQDFLRWLNQMRSFHDVSYVGEKPENRAGALVAFHSARETETERRWSRDIEQLDDAQLKTFATLVGVDFAELAASRTARADAKKAGQVAITKTSVEQPLLRLVNIGSQQMEKGMSDDLWQAVANLHRDEVKLDQASVALMRAEFPNAVQAGRMAMGGKGRIEDPIVRVVAQFENSIALDTVRNEYLLHRRIHEQFAGGDEVTSNVDALNEWVYAELFLTPSSDPWLGLAPRDVYTALDGGGQIVASATEIQ